MMFSLGVGLVAARFGLPNIVCVLDEEKNTAQILFVSDRIAESICLVENRFKKYRPRIVAVNLCAAWTKENNSVCDFIRSSGQKLSFSELGKQISKRCSNCRRRGIADERKGDAVWSVVEPWILGTRLAGVCV
jgi:hypothetical protein